MGSQYDINNRSLKMKVLFIFLLYLYSVFLNNSLIEPRFIYVSGEIENKKGFGLQERERIMEQKHEREHEDDDEDGFAINNLSGFFLLGTIFTIIGVSIFAGYKIYAIKKKARK